MRTKGVLELGNEDILELKDSLASLRVKFKFRLGLSLVPFIISLHQPQPDLTYIPAKKKG